MSAYTRDLPNVHMCPTQHRSINAPKAQVSAPSRRDDAETCGKRAPSSVGISHVPPAQRTAGRYTSVGHNTAQGAARLEAPPEITPSTVGKAAYERHRRRQLAYGRWNRWVDPDSARAHLEHLRRHGIGRCTASKQSGVSEPTIERILARRTPLIHVDVEARILALTAIHTPLIDATGARRRLQALVAEGWPQTELARRIGWRVNNLNVITLGKRPHVVPATHQAICDLYAQLAGQPAPDTYGGRRARTYATGHGWVTSDAWDDATIDDLAAAPLLGDGVDHVLVDLVLRGHRPYTALNDAEQVALWQAWQHRRRIELADGPGVAEFRRTFALTTHRVEALRLAAAGLNTRGNPINTAPEATGRRKEAA